MINDIRNEIERLLNRAANAEHAVEQLRSDLELRDETAHARFRIIRELEAEIERLRAVLQKMVQCSEDPCAFCFEMAATAKAALEQKDA